MNDVPLFAHPAHERSAQELGSSRDLERATDRARDLRSRHCGALLAAAFRRAERNLDADSACLVRVALALGYLPRATLVVENNRPEAVRIWLEARAGSGLARADLGIVGAHERRVIPNALPARRNRLSAIAADEAGESGFARRQIFHVANRGPETCGRRYLWPVR